MEDEDEDEDLDLDLGHCSIGIEFGLPSISPRL